ncbi:M50 family metallopeptidase [Syntrophomonas erecta]
MNLGKIAGVSLVVNPLFLLLCLVYIWLGWGLEILIITSAVLVHEIAHTLMAAGLGVKVVEIELLPFGGQARMEDLTGSEPDKEIFIALAGPLTSLSLAAFFHFLYSGSDSEPVSLFIYINLLLGCFNLLPALPLDGGRILRAWLSRISGYKKATARAALLGKLCAILIGGLGVYIAYYNIVGINLVIIAAILYWAAWREGQLLFYSFMRFLVNKKGELARNGMLPARQLVAYPDTLVKEVIASCKPSYYMLVVIVDNQHRIIGMKSEAELIELLMDKGPGARIGY